MGAISDAYNNGVKGTVTSQIVKPKTYATAKKGAIATALEEEKNKPLGKHDFESTAVPGTGEGAAFVAPSKTLDLKAAADAFKEQTKAPSGGERTVKTITGGAKGAAGNAVNSYNLALKGINSIDGAKEINQMAEEATANKVAEYKATVADPNANWFEKTWAKLKLAGTENQLKASDVEAARNNLMKSSQEDIERAKYKGSKTTQTLVDIGSNLTQLAGDVAFQKATGVSALVPMAVKSFGGGAYEAEQDGADIKGQALYGAATAATEVLTEKISGLNPVLNKAFGKGASDSIVKSLINKLAKTEAGKTALEYIIGSAGEGLEEILSDAINPASKSLYNGKSVDENYKEQLLTKDGIENALYDGLIGAAISGIIGAPSAAINMTNNIKTAQQNAKTNESYGDDIVKQHPWLGNVPTTPKNTANIAPTTTKTQANIAPNLNTAVEENGEEIVSKSEADIFNESLAQKQNEIATLEKEAEKQRAVYQNLYTEFKNTDISNRRPELVGEATAQKAKLQEAEARAEKARNELDQLQKKRDDDIESRAVAEAEKANKEEAKRIVSELNGRYVNDETVSRIEKLGVMTGEVQSVRKAFNVAVKAQNKVNALSTLITNSESLNETIELQEKLTKANAQLEKAAKALEEAQNRISQYSEPEISAAEPKTTTDKPTYSTANIAPKLNNNFPAGTGAASSGFDPFSHLQNQKSEFHKTGENPTRIVEVPTTDTKGKNISKAAQTAIEAGVTTDEAAEKVMGAIADERFSFKTIKDKDSMARATETINYKGWDTAVKDWTAEARSGKVSKDLLVMGQTLYNNAVNSGHTKEGVDILVDLVKMSRSGAQATQANRILKKMSPEGQLYALQRSVDNLTDELSTKVPNGIKINKDLADAYLKAETEEARSKAMDALKDDVAKQIPSNWLDKWNAWRYLSMLGNPRTHIRNIVGNAGFVPVRGAKNLIAAGIEKATGTEHKTKSVLTSKDADLKNAAKADYDAHADEVLENGKFNDSRTDLESRKTVFKFKALESVRKANDNALNTEDSWFAKPAYSNALASYCKANGITAEELAKGNSTKIDEARAYATREAQKATYRDCNAFSDWVASLGKNSKSTNKVAKLANVAVEGILPFKRTPANILARAVEYSPVGLVKGLTSDLVQVKKGNMEAWEAIDNISAGLTGTMLVGAGAFLSSLGVISGGASDDDKERTIDGLEGLQNYALNVGGKTITLDWLAPEALPLFVGVELFNTIKNKDDGEVTLSSVLTKIGNIAEPMLEMSMLQGVNDLFESIKYSESNSVLSILATATVNYLSQGLPTLFGQIERITEKERESTFVDNTSGVPASIQRMLGKAANKIPLLDYQQTPYVNALGNHQSSGSVWERIFSNSISPAYLSNKTDSAVTAELRRLNENHALTTYPQTADRYFDYDGKQYNMSADEYVKFEETGGKYANEYMSEAIKSNWYKTLNDEQKDAVLSNLQGYAKDKAKQAVIGNNYKSPELYKAAHKAEEKGISPTNFYTYKSALNQIDKNGSATQLESAQALQKTSMSNSEKGKLWALQNDDSDKNPYTGKLSQYGFSASQSIKIMEAYNKVKEEVEGSYVKPDGGAGVKSVCASYFEKWLRQNGYSSKQIENITDTYIYWNMIPAKTTKKSQRYVASRGMIIS